MLSKEKFIWEIRYWFYEKKSMVIFKIKRLFCNLVMYINWYLSKKEEIKLWLFLVSLIVLWRSSKFVLENQYFLIFKKFEKPQYFFSTKNMRFKFFSRKFSLWHKVALLSFINDFVKLFFFLFKNFPSRNWPTKS